MNIKTSNQNGLKSKFNIRNTIFPFDSGGTMYDMTDNVESFTAIRDEVQSYTMQEIFNAMQSNITSVPQFRDEVLIQNNFKEQMSMGILFGDYGF